MSCATCHSLQINNKGELTIPLPSIQATARHGCETCTMLLVAISAFLDLDTVESVNFTRHANWSEAGYRCPFYIFAQVKGWGQVLLALYTDNEIVTEKWPLIPVASHISFDSSSQVCLNQAQKWLDHCDENHGSSCRKPANNTTRLPTRVINVGDSAHRNPFLYETKNEETGLYATLSYCWGRSRAFTTTVDTFKNRKAGFNVEELPKTCAHAVIVARSLGVKYLWIDSLCIIQDDKHDWEREASKMCDVYENSYVTIAALDSPDSETGLFLSFPERTTAEIPVRVDTQTMANVYARREYSRAKMGFLHAFSPNSVLETRGWTLQEVTLSPRLLWFNARELGFSCKASTACECEPEPTQLLVKRSAQRLSVDHGGPDAGNQDWQIMWRDIVHTFTQRKLTQATDRLPALAGLAAAMQKMIGGIYLYGLWENGLEKDLLWTSVWDSEQSTEGRVTQILKPDYATSWSWASVSGEVWFMNSPLTPRFQTMWKVLDVHVSPSTSNSFGPGKGLLAIEGIALPLRVEDECLIFEHAGDVLTSDNDLDSWFPDNRDGICQDTTGLAAKTLRFLLAGILVRGSSVTSIGLVLEKVDDGCWRRVGLVEAEQAKKRRWDWAKMGVRGTMMIV